MKNDHALSCSLELFDQVESLLHAYDTTGHLSLHRCSDGSIVLQLTTRWPLRPGMHDGLRALTEEQDMVWIRMKYVTTSPELSTQPPPDTLTLRAQLLPQLTELGCPLSGIALG